MGAVFARPADAGTDGFWDLYSRYYDAIYQLMPYRKLLWDTFQALDLRPGMRVLDAGCGTGNFEAFIAEKDPPAIEVEAIDFSPRMLQVARKKCDRLGAYTFSQADLNQPLPFADASFDRVLSINVLYALDDPGATMGEFTRVLKPSGRLVLTSPRPSFRIIPLLADHFGRVRNIWGLRRKVEAVLRSISVLLTTGIAQVAMSSIVINGREADGTYRSLDREEVAELLERFRLDGLARYDVGWSFAGQNVFATAVKAAA